jgi:hypothetical protein
MAIRREFVIPLLTGLSLLMVGLVVAFTRGVVEAAALAVVVGVLAGAYLARRHARNHLVYSRKTRSDEDLRDTHRT